MVPAALMMVGPTVACASGGAGTASPVGTPEAATDSGRFVWHDLVTRNAEASWRSAYGGLSMGVGIPIR